MGSFKRIYTFCETPPGVIKAVDCGIGTPANIEYSYFHSVNLPDGDMEPSFSENVIQVLQPGSPINFLMFNLARSSPGSGISSSGANLQFIDTVEAGEYEFHVQFTISNIGQDAKPELLLTLGTPAAAPYVNPTTGFFEVTTTFQPVTDKDGFSLQHLAVMHGVVELPAVSSTAVLIKPGGAIPGPDYEVSTFNVTVKKLA